MNYSIIFYIVIGLAIVFVIGALIISFLRSRNDEGIDRKNNPSKLSKWCKLGCESCDCCHCDSCECD